MIGSTVFPIPQAEIEGASAWYGRDMSQNDEWVYTFDGRDIEEIETAMRESEQAGVELAELNARCFALPRLSVKLQAIRDELLHGRGFVLLRGLPVEHYSVAQAARAYLGIGAHIGKPVSQNAAGHLLGHIIDLGRDEDDPNSRVYQTHARQYYHADSCDIVGLLCLKKAKRGGTSTIVSSVTLFNEMKRRYPQLVSELFSSFHVDRRGEVPSGRDPWFECPVFNWHAGLLSTYYVRRYIFSSRRFEQVPPLEPVQIEAFDAFDAIAEEEGVHLKMDFEPGDIQLLHNHQILHDRTAFEDWPEPERRRHLLRLWLCPPQGRSLPDTYVDRWGSIAPGDRGGIIVPGAKLVAPLAPE